MCFYLCYFNCIGFYCFVDEITIVIVLKSWSFLKIHYSILIFLNKSIIFTKYLEKYELLTCLKQNQTLNIFFDMNISRYKFYSFTSGIVCVLLLCSVEASAQRRRGNSPVEQSQGRQVVKTNTKEEHFKQQAKELQRQLKETEKRLKDTEKDLAKTQKNLDKCAVKSQEWNSKNPYYAGASNQSKDSYYEDDDYYYEDEVSVPVKTRANGSLDAEAQKDLIEIEVLKQTLAEKQENQKKQMEQLMELKNAIQGLKDSQYIEYDDENIYEDDYY